MDQTLIIQALSTAIGVFGGIVASSRLTSYRIEQLEKKMDKHNDVITRMFKVEEHQCVCDEKIKIINHRLEDIEGGKWMKEQIVKLFTVKSIITIVLTLVFAYLSIIGKINAEQYMNVFLIIIAFYFGVQSNKNKE